MTRQAALNECTESEPVCVYSSKVNKLPYYGTTLDTTWLLWHLPGNNLNRVHFKKKKNKKNTGCQNLICSANELFAKHLCISQIRFTDFVKFSNDSNSHKVCLDAAETYVYNAYMLTHMSACIYYVFSLPILNLRLKWHSMQCLGRWKHLSFLDSPST